VPRHDRLLVEDSKNFLLQLIYTWAEVPICRQLDQAHSTQLSEQFRRKLSKQFLSVETAIAGGVYHYGHRHPIVGDFCK